MKLIDTVAIGLAFAVPSSYAWGASGHQSVGYVAMQFLKPKAAAYVASSLGSSFSSSLGPGATWADEIKSQAAYKWSSVLHYVDALDDPPTSCSVSQSRDCADGNCILTAIANYTARVVEPSLSAAQRQEALLFLDHFIGDIGQPLHVENKAVGGNEISVTCGGSTSNLHSVWDSGILNKLLSAKYGGSVTTFSNALVTRIKSGDFAASTSGWVSCSSTTATSRPRHPYTIRDDIEQFLHSQHKGTVTPLKCPLVWAADSNKYDCSAVFTYTSGTDLCTGTYYDKAVPIIELQIAKQGYRLAAWLNVLFDGVPKARL